MITEGRTTDVPVPVASAAARQGLGDLTLGVQIGDGLVIFGNPRGRYGISSADYQRMLGRKPCPRCHGTGDHPGCRFMSRWLPCPRCDGNGWLA